MDSRKDISFAASQAAKSTAEAVKKHGLKSVEVYVKGPGSGRNSAIRSLKDVTPIPHNGCRTPKRRK